jgi:hypothetical protein
MDKKGRITNEYLQAKRSNPRRVFDFVIHCLIKQLKTRIFTDWVSNRQENQLAGELPWLIGTKNTVNRGSRMFEPALTVLLIQFLV